MTPVPKSTSPLLQCRGPERRVTVWHVAAAVALVGLFLGGVGLLKLPPPAAVAAHALR